MNTKNKAFTLVELIVVIVILAILATIAFLSFSSQTSSARDSVRVADLSNISKGLSINYAIGGVYPAPDKSVNLFSGGTQIGYQGEAGTAVLNIAKLSAGGGKDPLDKTYYTYSTNVTKSKQQLVCFLENKGTYLLGLNPFSGLNDAFAQEYTNRFAYEKGDALGIILSQSGTATVTYIPLQDSVAAGTNFDVKSAASNSGKVAVINNSTSTPGLLSSAVLIGYTGTGASYSGTGSATGGIVAYDSTRYKQIGFGYDYAIALKSNGTVWIWGSNGNGEFGNGLTGDYTPRNPVQIAALSNITQIAAGRYSVWALKSDGTVWAWGQNGYGQLGNGTTNDSAVPTQVPGLSSITSIQAGRYNVAAFKSDGNIYTWGMNGNGELNLGTTVDQLTPALNNNLKTYQGFSLGNTSTIAYKADGSVWIWGQNNYGQLADGTTNNNSTPTKINSLTGVIGVSAGDPIESVLKSDGTVWTWGDSDKNSAPGGTIYSLTPIKVPGITGVSLLQSGDHHILMYKSDGSVWVWGRNNNGGTWGDYGNGTTSIGLPSASLVDNSGNIVYMAGGDDLSCLVKGDGSIWLSGANYYGQQGTGDTTDINTLTMLPGIKLF